MRKCPNCGLEITNEKVKFCYECGCKLEEVKNVEVTTETIEENDFYSKSKVENGKLIKYKGDDENIIIPEGITSICNYAFDSAKLKSVYIPSTVTHIDGGAFYIVLSHATLSKNPYGGCLSLENIKVHEDNPMFESIDGNLYLKKEKTLVFYAPGKPNQTFTIPEGVISMSWNPFFGCLNLKKVVLPSTYGKDEFEFEYPPHEIKIEISSKNPNYKIKDGHVYSKDGKTFTLFDRYNKDKHFIFPTTVKKIGKSAFSLADRLEYVIIPHGVKEIEEKAFEACENLSAVVIPESITSIGKEAFAGCNELDNVIIPNGITTIASGMFVSSAIRNIAIPSSVVTIEKEAFNLCTNLKEVHIPSNVKEIQEAAFAECYKLKVVDLSEGLEVIGDSAFYDTKIESIKIPSTVKEIGIDVFAECKNLIEIYVSKGKKYNNLPSNVKVKEY